MTEEKKRNTRKRKRETKREETLQNRRFKAEESSRKLKNGD
jgi:hypothetical protein